MAVAARQQNDDQYRSLVENLPDAILVTDTRGLIRFANPAAGTFLGGTPEELLGRPVGFPITTSAFAKVHLVQTESKGAFAELRVARVTWQAEPAYLLSMRGVAPGRDASADDGPRGPVVVIHNVQGRKDAEKLLLKTEKLESARRMAATLAHEINNPLAATMNSLFLALQDSSLSKSARQTLKQAEKEVKRIAYLTRQALGFYKESGPPAAVELPELVNGVLDLFATKIADKSIHVTHLHRGASRVCAVEGELRQIISNLVANGIDAVTETGTIHIRTACPISLHGIPMMRLTVADTGSGIPSDNLSRIFEAFFTTKQSVGTGLGLWATRELVSKHGGKIRFRSGVDKGTVFTVWIPTEC